MMFMNIINYTMLYYYYHAMLYIYIIIGLGNQEGSAVADGTERSADTARASRGRTGSSIDKKALPDLKQFKNLLVVDEQLVNKVLTTKEIRTKENGRLQSAFVSMNPTQAADRRDSLARSLYEKLFDYIVLLINRQLITPSRDSSKNEKLLSIGVLDIYGFEIFQRNGFEQLQINYVNEKLQQIFIELTLRTEQDEYAREGIQWTPIPFFNNRIVCELLDGANPGGLFRILDDVCKTNQALKNTAELDNKMLRAAVQVHSNHPHFSSNKEKSFVIKHYAGDVEYQLGSFGETNKDALGNDLIELMRTSGLELVREGMYGGMADESKAQTAGGRLRSQCNVSYMIYMYMRSIY